MKIMFASDIHGSAFYCNKMIEAYKKEKAQMLVILGDILYHGPRNDLPKEYNPKQVIEMLNGMKEELMVIRGNCDTEVDQMVLEFPIMADYAILFADNKKIFATHGHVYNEENLPALIKGNILIHGHTHLPVTKRMKDYTILNPGSVSIPKGGYDHSYGVLNQAYFVIKNFSNDIIKEIQL